MWARKRPVATRTPSRSTAATKYVVQVFGLRGRCGLHETRSTSFATVTPQRELTDHQHVAADFSQRAIHLALIVFEDPQPDQFLCQEIGIRRLSW